jgi:hypothetical protein
MQQLARQQLWRAYLQLTGEHGKTFVKTSLCVSAAEVFAA